MGPFGSPKALVGGLLDLSCDVLRASWPFWKQYWAVLKRSWCPLSALGALWSGPGTPGGRPGSLPGRAPWYKVGASLGPRGWDLPH
eukprot:5574294-Pyramimonas_sp.AAC.1